LMPCANPLQICDTAGQYGPANRCLTSPGDGGVDALTLACRSAMDCPLGLPLCSANACVECASGADCPAAKPVCEASHCRLCQNHDDCPSHACVLPEGRCAMADELIY